jgi:hypothetical protein
MDPVRSCLGGGLAATAVATVVLVVVDFLLGGAELFAFTTLSGVCVIAGEPYCGSGTLTAALLRYFWFALLFVVAWPLLFAGFTWGLPGESGVAHGAVYGLVLWAGYAVVVAYGIGLGGESVAENVPLLAVTLVTYLVYGVVLGGGYDYLAGHRTFLSRDGTLPGDRAP